MPLKLSIHSYISVFEKKGVLSAQGTFLWASAHVVYLCCGVVASIYDSYVQPLTLNLFSVEKLKIL